MNTKNKIQRPSRIELYAIGVCGLVVGAVSMIVGLYLLMFTLFGIPVVIVSFLFMVMNTLMVQRLLGLVKQ